MTWKSPCAPAPEPAIKSPQLSIWITVARMFGSTPYSFDHSRIFGTQCCTSGVKTAPTEGGDSAPGAPGSGAVLKLPRTSMIVMAPRTPAARPIAPIISTSCRGSRRTHQRCTDRILHRINRYSTTLHSIPRSTSDWGWNSQCLHRVPGWQVASTDIHRPDWHGQPGQRKAIALVQPLRLDVRLLCIDGDAHHTAPQELPDHFPDQQAADTLTLHVGQHRQPGQMRAILVHGRDLVAHHPPIEFGYRETVGRTGGLPQSEE